MHPPISYTVAKKPLPKLLNAFGVDGVSFRAMDDETGRLWMVCEVNDAMFVKDVASVMHLEHKNLVRYVVPSSTSTTSSSTTIPIFGELCSGGPLSSLLESIVDDCDVPSSLSLNVVASYLLQITSGLAYLHSQGHFHGGSLGVCVENVFLCRGNILKASSLAG
jgi:serine/threonine protein kinase